MSQPRRLLLDSNVSDVLVVDASLRGRLRTAVDAGLVELLVTHVQIDENLDHPDGDQGRQLVHALLAAGARAVPTSGFVLGVSRLDGAALFDDAAAAMFEGFRQGNPRHTEDGLLAATSLACHAAFVTEENDQHRRRLRRHFKGLEVWSVREMEAFLDQLDTKVIFEGRTVAAGSIRTPPFEGPGEVSASTAIRAGDLHHPRVVITLPQPSRLDDDPVTTFSYHLDQVAGGLIDVSVIVRRSSAGLEPVRIFDWRLDEGQCPQ